MKFKGNQDTKKRPSGITMTNSFLYSKGTVVSRGRAGPKAHTQGARPTSSQLRPVSMLLWYVVKILSHVLDLLFSKEGGGGGRKREEISRSGVSRVESTPLEQFQVTDVWRLEGE